MVATRVLPSPVAISAILPSCSTVAPKSCTSVGHHEPLLGASHTLPAAPHQAATGFLHEGKGLGHDLFQELGLRVQDLAIQFVEAVVESVALVGSQVAAQLRLDLTELAAPGGRAVGDGRFEFGRLADQLLVAQLLELIGQTVDVGNGVGDFLEFALRLRSE